MAKKKSWKEKLQGNPDLPKIQEITSETDPHRVTGWMVIPSPMEVYEIMSKIPEGKLITLQEIRSILARRHGADLACPLTTGLFASIAAHAAEEAGAGTGEEGMVPYWRTLKTGGILNEKYPGGAEEQTRRLQGEGHQVGRRGKHHIVEGYEDSVVDEVEFQELV
jgi:alkylated DNA nucleotide flippase Atl1